MTPGERIQYARELLEPKLSTKELDFLAGFKPGFVWSVEDSGGANTESSRLDRIARVLGVSMDWLIRGDGDPPTAESVAASVAVARFAKPKDKAS
jgi:hypothetical protein